MRFQLDPLSPSGISIAPEPQKITNHGGYAGSPDITRVLQPGTNVTFTGSGTQQSPYIVNASGGGGSGTVSSVDVSGGTTGLTTSGGPVTTSGVITLAGVLAIANGGTGSATQNFVDLTTNQTLGDGKTITVGTTTGTKIATSTNQKLGFYNATPVVQPTGSVITALSNLGLVGTPTLASTELSDTASIALAANTLTFTNKTFDTAGAGNVLKINGTQITAKTGTGNVVLANTPALTTPNIGTATATKLLITTGANASAGTGTLASGTVTIATTLVTANSLIFLTDTSNGANLGILSVGTKTAATSFVVNSSNVLDGSTFNWLIIN